MISNEKISEMVNLVHNKQFKIKELWNDKKGKIYFERKEGVLVEPTKEFKNVITDFVVNEFSKSPEQNFKFLKLVYNTFNTAIGEYRTLKGLPKEAVFFVYKGGNVLRIVANEVFGELAGNAAMKLKNYYSPVFKKSDADFSIYVDPRLPNFKDVYEDMIQLAFILQNQIRIEFLKDPSAFFEFYKLNDSAKRQVLQKYLNTLNETGNVKEKKYGYDGNFNAIAFKDIVVGKAEGGINPFYKPKPDIEMDYEGNEGKTFLMTLKPISKSNSPALTDIATDQAAIYKNNDTSELYVSANRTLKFEKSPGNFASFALVRTKLTMTSFFNYANPSVKPDDIDSDALAEGQMNPVNLDGEVIDVSIPNIDDSEIFHFFEHKDENLRKYSIGSGDNAIVLRSYSLSYLLYDLERMLFKDNPSPWDDKKYAKRMNRTLFLYFVILMTRNTMSNKGRIAYFNFVKDYILMPLKTGDKDRSLKTITLFLNAVKENMQQKNKKEDDYPFYVLIDNLQRLLTRDATARGCKLEEIFGSQMDNPEVKALVNKVGSKIAEIDNKELQDYVDVLLENINKIVEVINDIETYRNNPSIPEAGLFDATEVK